MAILVFAGAPVRANLIDLAVRHQRKPSLMERFGAAGLA